MGNISERDKTMLVILVIAVLIFFFYRFVWAALEPAYHAARENLEAAQASWEEAQNKISRLPAVQRRWEEARESFAVTEKNFRLNLAAGDPYLKLAEEAMAVEIVAIQPRQVEDRQSYLELPLTVRVRGDYVAVAGFVERVERLPNLPRIKTLRLAAISGAESAVTGPQVEAEIVLSLYGSKAAAAGPPAVPAVAGRLNAFVPALDTLLNAARQEEESRVPATSSGGAVPAAEAAPAGGAAPGEQTAEQPLPGTGTKEQAGEAGREGPGDIQDRYRFPLRR